MYRNGCGNGVQSNLIKKFGITKGKCTSANGMLFQLDISIKREIGKVYVVRPHGVRTDRTT